MDDVTPELALVDRELAALARLRLPLPSDTLAARPRPRVDTSPRAMASGSDQAELALAHRSLDVASAASSLRAVVVVVMLVSAFLGPVAVDLIGRNLVAGASPGSPLSARALPHSTAVPTLPSVPAPARTLRWRPVPRAKVYDVILWRDGARVVDLWTHRASVRIRVGAIAPGRYIWFVYPSSGAERGYGRLVAHGAFVVRTGP